jgi:hypothetical protein
MTQTVYVKFSYENKVSEEIPIHTQLDLSKNAGINRRRLLNLLLKSDPNITQVTLLSQQNDTQQSTIQPVR